MSNLKVLNPVARSMEARVEPAPRPRDLSGRRVGLYWNLKTGGDAALQQTERRLRERYPDARFAYYNGEVGQGRRTASRALVDRMAAECDAVVGTSGD